MGDAYTVDQLTPQGVNITLLPSITPPDYAGYVKAAMDEGIDVFETAGNNRELSG